MIRNVPSIIKTLVNFLPSSCLSDADKKYIERGYLSGAFDKITDRIQAALDEALTLKISNTDRKILQELVAKYNQIVSKEEDLHQLYYNLNLKPYFKSFEKNGGDEDEDDSFLGFREVDANDIAEIIETISADIDSSSEIKQESSSKEPSKTKSKSDMPEKTFSNNNLTR